MRKHNSHCEGWKTAGDQLIAAHKTWKFWRWRTMHHLKDMGMEYLREIRGECPDVVNGRRVTDEHAAVDK